MPPSWRRALRKSLASSKDRKVASRRELECMIGRPCFRLAACSHFARDGTGGQPGPVVAPRSGGPHLTFGNCCCDLIRGNFSLRLAAPMAPDGFRTAGLTASGGKVSWPRFVSTS